MSSRFVFGARAKIIGVACFAGFSAAVAIACGSSGDDSSSTSTVDASSDAISVSDASADADDFDGGPCYVKNTTLPTLAWTPRSDWVVVTGAKGDGIADDTQAIQTALAQVTDDSNLEEKRTVFLPAGTYRITSTLDAAKQVQGFSLIGTGETTKVIWDGPASAPDASADAPDGGDTSVMFHSDGLTHALFQGIVWDGQGKASIGVDHDSNGYFETAMRHYDERFQNFTVGGIVTKGHANYATAEMLVKNSVFMNSAAGVILQSFNDYDNKIQGCVFVNDGYGVDSHDGNFNVSSSNFVGSTISDMNINPHSFRAQSIVSKCSAQTVHVYQTGIGAEVMMNDSRVSDWTGDAGAVSLGSSGPYTFFDNAFSRTGLVGASDAGPPISFQHSVLGSDPTKEPQSIITSNQTMSGGAPVMDLGPDGTDLDIPPGPSSASKITTDTWFQNTSPSQPVPSKIFDAVKDFGATTGPDVDDDTPKIQAAIDAARTAGNGAMAYLPAGRYFVNKPLDVHGSNYVVSGNGFRTMIYWSGSTDGGTSDDVQMAVTDPDHVTIANLQFEPVSTVAAIRQTSSSASAASFVTYENIAVPGSFLGPAQSIGTTETTRSIEIASLSASSVVHANMFYGTVNVTDSAQATIFVDVWESGVTRISGSTTQPHTGFFGVGARYNAGNAYDYDIADNNSIVVGHSYTETTGRLLRAVGTPSLPAGQIVIGIAKAQLGFSDVIDVDDFGGLISIGEGFVLYDFPTGSGNGYHVQQTGTSPLDVLFWGNTFWEMPVFDVQATTTPLFMQSQTNGDGSSTQTKIPNATSAAAVSAMAATLDAQRSLRAHELSIDYGL